MIHQRAFDAILEALDDIVALARACGLWRTSEQAALALREARQEQFEAVPRRPIAIQFLIGPVREQSEAELQRRPVSPSAGRRHPWLSTSHRPEEGIIMITITDSQKVIVTAKFASKRGNPVDVQNPVWSVDDETILTVEPDATPGINSALVKATGMPGQGRVVLTADADLGEGVVPVVGHLEVTVVAGQATVVELAAGSPEEQ